MEVERGFDDIADALGHRERRRLVVELMDHNPMAQREALEEASRPTGETEVQLYHRHLPKLDHMGYIAWNRDGGTITKGPYWEDIEPVVRMLADRRDQLPGDTF